MADTNLSSFIWSVADLLRGNYKQSEYGKVILPFTVLRRLDCVLEPTKAAVVTALERAVKLFRDPSALTATRRAAMARDSSWTASAQQYIELYESLR